MEYVALLSQEHPALPRAELEAALAADGIEAEMTGQRDALLFLDGEDVAQVADRVAMTFELSEVLHTFDPATYQKLAAQNITAGSPFAVRTVNVDGTDAPAELEENVGRIIDNNSDAAVELEAPEEAFRVYLVDGDAYLCRTSTARTPRRSPSTRGWRAPSSTCQRWNGAARCSTRSAAPAASSWKQG
ncbi:MAG: hypothetical protein ABEI97_03905 [Candidatus Nanohaloarchaea archaeon]